MELTVYSISFHKFITLPPLNQLCLVYQFLCLIKYVCFVEVFAFLGCYAAYVGSCLPMFWDSLLILSSRVKQNKKFGCLISVSWFIHGHSA